ncbi:MAG: hypothetical protein HGA23_08565 [Bacteroidales bacterium]|nr:hypothetical protein [Bacteroidales bacterium]
MKKVAVLSLLFLFGFIYYSAAQDIIYKKDGSKEEAKITLVGVKEIQYKKISNPDGPVYSLAKSEILMITYENGEFEVFQVQGDISKQTKQELATNFAKNVFGYHLFDVIYGDFTFSYERILSSGTVGIKIPVGFGYAYNSDYFNNNNEWVKNLFYSGISVYLYPTGQGKWRYFLGPNVRVGYGKQSDWMTYYDDYGNYLYDEEVDNEGIYTKFYMDNGVMFTPVRNFSISAVVGVGVRYFPEAGSYSNAVMPTAYFSMNIGYRF